MVPAVAMGGLVWVAYGNVHPLPPSPLSDFIWVTIAGTIGIAGLAYWLKRNRPDIVDRAGYVFEAPEELAIQLEGTAPNLG